MLEVVMPCNWVGVYPHSGGYNDDKTVSTPTVVGKVTVHDIKAYRGRKGTAPLL